MATVRDAAEVPASSGPGSLKAAQPVTPAKATNKIMPTPAVPARVSSARLELLDPLSQDVQRFELNKDVIRLGRDPEGEVVIDAAAAVVSRRHAELRRTGDQ